MSISEKRLSQERDEEVLRQQEERRKANAATETESRMRNSTVQFGCCLLLFLV